MSKFSFIIISWNVYESLKRCLDSLSKLDYHNYEVIVVDNASTDKSSELATIKNTTNVGFPKAVNQGIAVLKDYEYVVLLNPDTQLPSDFCKQSVEFFTKYKDAGVMGPKFVNSDGSSQGSVFPEPSINKFIQEFWLNRGPLTQKYTPNSTEPLEVSAVSGGCMVIPKTTIAKVGLLTQSVFMFYEDLDYCRRVRSLGLKVYFNPQITILHEHGSSTKKSAQSTQYLINASRWYNGWIKYYLLWFISFTGQKLRLLLHP